jgi:hypothetical protein
VEPGDVSCPAAITIRECPDLRCQRFGGSPCSEDRAAVTWPLQPEGGSVRDIDVPYHDDNGNFFYMYCFYERPDGSCAASFLTYWVVPGDTFTYATTPHRACDAPGEVLEDGNHVNSATHQVVVSTPTLSDDDVFNDDVIALARELLTIVEPFAAPCE